MPITPLHNERDLLAKIAIGDEAAFAEMFKWCYEDLGTTIFRLTESITLTEEIVQDAFVQIWLRKEKLTEITDTCPKKISATENILQQQERKKSSVQVVFNPQPPKSKK